MKQLLFCSFAKRLTDRSITTKIVFSLPYNIHILVDENASQVIFELPTEIWRRPPGRPRTTWMKAWIWSCMKPENWLRIDRSGDWCLCIALVMVHATIGLAYTLNEKNDGHTLQWRVVIKHFKMQRFSLYSHTGIVIIIKRLYYNVESKLSNSSYLAQRK